MLVFLCMLRGALRRFIKKRGVVNQFGGWDSLLYRGKFSINRAYNYFIKDIPTVSWRNIMKRNYASPSALFITWLAIQNRLATKDRISKWMEDCTVECDLCHQWEESMAHILFDCPNAQEIRKLVFARLKFHRDAGSIQEEIDLMQWLNAKKTDRAKTIVALWIEMIYRI